MFKNQKKAKAFWSRNQNALLSFLSLLAYLVAFITLHYVKPGGVAALAVIPVCAIAWLYGWVPGLAAGIISMPVNILLYQLLGDNWSLYISKGALLEGTCALIAFGTIIGRVSQLSKRLKRELLEKIVLQEELQRHRRNLEQEVHSKTSELRASYQQLSAANQQLDAQFQQLKANEADIVKTNQLLESTFHASADGLLLTDAQGYIIRTNKALADMLGSTIHELTGKHMAELAPQEEPYVTLGAEFMNIMRDHGIVRNFETGLHARKGICPVELSAVHLRDEQSTVTGSLINIRDISERKKAEDLLRQSAIRFQSVVETAVDAIMSTNSRGEIISWNKAAAEIYGYTADEIIGQPVRILIPKRFHDLESRNIYEVLKQIQPGVVRKIAESVGIRKDGTQFPTEVSQSVWMVGGETYFTGIVRDISERKRNEEELLRLAAIVEYAAEIIFVTDLTGHFIYVNPAFERISGFSAGEVIGEHTSQQVPRNYDKAVFADMISCIYDGKRWQGRVTKKKKDGSLYEVMAVLSPIKNAQGEVVSYVSIERDITHELELERSLLQAQKMEAIGTMAGGIAHDFNNILTAAMGFTEMALLKLPEDSPAAGDLRQVLKSTKRARDLVKQILIFSRKGTQEKKPVRMSEVINDSLKLIRAALPSTIDIQCTAKITDDIILADQTQMHQVIMNLCTNAADAMQECGGTLSINLSSMTIDTDKSAQYADLQRGRYCCLTVSDTGEGIDSNIIDKIFDPFFTTKEAGKGTGMGLAVVHGIVKNHNGSVRFSSEKGKGTTVQVLLPIRDSAELPDRRAVQHIAGGSEHILLIDDEADVLNVTSALLTSLGYCVEATTDSTKALDLVKSDPTQFDLVITDYTMPRMTGDVIAQQILKARPDMPIILCTGYNSRISAEAARAIGIRDLLMKPLNRQDLADNIRAVLDHTR